ncbi:glycosyltransferase family 4 protein [Sphingomonas sp. R86520]|uniref:glycosyltransferase family 4 protein n=1 Tax=Sphingomonas sp. R86520 TaxID=3093859 RepID=UPI0036D2ACD3
MKRPTVLFVTAILTHYREAFHVLVRDMLAERGIDYRLVQGTPLPHEAAKADTIQLDWSTTIPSRGIGPGGRALLWQPALLLLPGADLVVVTQENRLLLNYLLQVMPRWLRPRIGFWGHGRNFQARDPQSRAERWKRFWATRCDWWFAYTEESAQHVRSLGFPQERVTVFNNAVDTGALQRAAAALDPVETAALQARLGVAGDSVAIFVGGLYPDKRLDFLVAAADRVRARLPDFALIVVGGGEDREKLDTLAASRPWLIVAGPRFGAEKAALMQMARLFLMPGLLGLGVLDAGVMGLPVVTTRYPWHSPEIAYLRDGETGVVVPEWTSEEAYAEAVVALLLDEDRRAAMAAAARAHAAGFTIEAMARRFADGAVAALAMPRR